MVSLPVAVLLCAQVISTSIPAASGKALREQVEVQAFGEELQEALSEVMGCGGQVGTANLEQIKLDLKPLWRTLPKSLNGQVEWRSLRYITHRYFMKQSSLMIKGFEPFLASNLSASTILSKQLPTYINHMLGNKQGLFSFDDATYLVATLEQLLFDSETHLLEQVFDRLNIMTLSDISFDKLKTTIEAYMIHWMMGEDQDGIDILMKNKTVLETAFPHWHDIKHFVVGRIQTMKFQRTHRLTSGHAKSLLEDQYSFNDAHQVVGGITKSFQAYWESECEDMKTSLLALDGANTGRVHLSDFYRAGLKEEWRFAESEKYLREMGALDETAMWHGKQVIIANYLQGTSNCIVTTPQYRICCSNPCEGILSDIEAQVGSGMASPTEILQIVGNMTTENDTPIRLKQMLVDQLQQIADQHGKQVALHSRLFAQWLHYVFPHDCVFPHKSGSVKLASPLEFGDFVASKFDMRKEVQKKVEHLSQQNETVVELPIMTQWSSEEEFFADYSLEMQAPWEARYHGTIGGFALTLLAVLAIWLRASTNRKDLNLDLPLVGRAPQMKSHWV